MCGIAGQLALDPSATLTLEHIKPMCDVIVHRGPDDEGLFVDGPLAMGMRRPTPKAFELILMDGGAWRRLNSDQSMRSSNVSATARSPTALATRPGSRRDCTHASRASSTWS